MIAFRSVLLLIATGLVILDSSSTVEARAKAQCTIAADCINSQFQRCLNSTCVHKDVMPPIPLEIGGIIILPLLLGLANIGGIGGGGLIIPVCIAMFGFTTIQAIALSNSTICVGALLRYLGFSIY